MPSTRLLQRRYRRVAAFLAALPVEQVRVRLTLADLDALLGSPTADSSTGIPTWTVLGVVQSFREREGFAATLDRADYSILFTRLPCERLTNRAQR